MRKWVGPILSILIIALLLLITLASNIFKPVSNKKENTGKTRIVLTQDTQRDGKGGKEDTYYITLLKQIDEKVDVWLKSLNETIEKEDITHFEVRFYEILRNILEWVREKINAKIDSSEGRNLRQTAKEGLSQEARQRVSPIFDRG
jgi:uncharacterized protein YpmB